MRVLLLAMTLIVGCTSSCFAQAGSPDQAMFNRAVMKYRETVERELEKVNKAVAAADGENASGNPIRANLVGGDAARQGAIALSSSAAAVQVRAQQLGVDEWVAVVDRVVDMQAQRADESAVKFPSRYLISLTWCPSSEKEFTTAITATEHPADAGQALQKIKEEFNVVQMMLWIDDSNKELLNAAASVNPGDAILFTIDTSHAHELRATRLREYTALTDVETKLLQAANLNCKVPYGWVAPAVNVQLGKHKLVLSAPPWKVELPKGEGDPPLKWDGFHLKSIRAIDLDAAKKRSVAACALAGVIEQQVFADRVKSAMAAANAAGVETWLGGITNSPERLMREAEARVFGERGAPERTALTIEAAKSAAASAPEKMKAEALLALAVAELRAGKSAEAAAALEEFEKLKASDDELLKASVVRCLMHLAEGKRDVAAQEGTVIRDSVRADSRVIDYRTLALLAEVQSAIGIEAGKGDAEVELKFTPRPARGK